VYTYTITTDHPASSYGMPVLLDADGIAYGAADVGLYGLPKNLCGRVDAGGDVYWSGYSENPMKMWNALRAAHNAHPELLTVGIVDAGKVILK
jgi:hypothetical protein